MSNQTGMDRNSKVYVAGHRGLVGSALVRRLKAAGYEHVITRTHADLDLRDQQSARDFFDRERPQYVFLAAAKVGGILANATHQAQFMYDNLMIATNVIHAAYEFGVSKMLNLGSSCIYPRRAPQPMKEEHLLTGVLEQTNEAYAVAKIAAIKMCRYYNEQYGTDFISIMPTNLYGPNDNYDLDSSHVLPALIRKTHEAKTRGTAVELWGDGTPRREFLYVDDLADAAIYLINTYGHDQIGELINVGTGRDCTIMDLAGLIAEVVGYKGGYRWDTTKPNGTPQKLLDVSRLRALGWEAKVGLKEGIQRTYDWYVKHGQPAQTN